MLRVFHFFVAWTGKPLLPFRQSRTFSWDGGLGGAVCFFSLPTAFQVIGPTLPSGSTFAAICATRVALFSAWSKAPVLLTANPLVRSLARQRRTGIESPSPRRNGRSSSCLSSAFSQASMSPSFVEAPFLSSVPVEACLHLEQTNLLRGNRRREPPCSFYDARRAAG